MGKMHFIQVIKSKFSVLSSDMSLLPTLSLGIILRSDPCFKNTFPALCDGFMPIPSFVIIALVAGGTLNSSAANFKTAVNGVPSGTLSTLNGNFGSEVKVILKVTFDLKERYKGW